MSFPNIAASALLFLAAGPMNAAVLVLDTFSEGQVNLSQDESGGDTDVIPGKPFESREIGAANTGPYSVTSVSGSGILNYTIAVRGQSAERSEFLSIFYTKSSSSSAKLLGVDAFVLKVTSIVGEGNLTISLNVGFSMTIPVALNAPGEIIFPLSNFGRPFDLNLITKVGFHFVPSSPNFSITLDEISAVPEPSASLLLGIGGWVCLRRRRTSDAAGLAFTATCTHRQLEMEYQFGSEEYDDQISLFNDGFLLLVDDVPVSLLPDASGLAGVNTINLNANRHLFFGDDEDIDPLMLPANQPIQVEYDGMTAALKVHAFVTPGVNHKFRFLIGDINDSRYDSALFIKQGSVRTVSPQP